MPSTNSNPFSFFIDESALKALKLVAVAYSFVDPADFPNQGAYEAEAEVENRAEEVIAEVAKLGIAVKGYAADQYFFTNVLVDKPDMVLNLVDTVRGREALQPAIPGALELSNMQYTGAGLKGLVIGNDRNMFKHTRDVIVVNQPSMFEISSVSAPATFSQVS